MHLQPSVLLSAIWLSLILTGARRVRADAVQCVRKLTACSCETAQGGRIDLTPLAKQGAFAFDSVKGPTTFLYYYNPCEGVNCDGSTDAAVCQKTADMKYQYLMGTQASAKFETDPTLGLTLKYIAQSGDRLIRETQIQLLCDTTGRDQTVLTPLDDGIPGTSSVLYKMSLLSKHCCDSIEGGGGGLSVGDVLLIVFFSLLLVYLAAGLAVNLAVRKQTFGWHALPNATFWASLPGLVKDGSVFAYGSAKDAVNRRRGLYESV